MYLRMYLAKERISITQFAKDLGFSRAHIQGICTGRFSPSADLANKIMNMTSGLVTMIDLEQAYQEFHEKEMKKCFDKCKKVKKQ